MLEAADPDPAVEIDIILGETRFLADLPEELTTLPDRHSPPDGVAHQSPLVAEQPATEAAATAAKKHSAPEVPVPLMVQQAIDETYVPVLMKIVEGVPYAMQPYEFSRDEADDSGAREDVSRRPQRRRGRRRRMPSKAIPRMIARPISSRMMKPP